jgi:two-component system nitrogen regulation sensor histidine kinase NtrY
MTLRAKLVLALTIAALVPMGAVLALSLLQADRRAREGAGRRLGDARRQAGLVIEREKKEVASRVEGAVAALARQGAGARSPRQEGAAGQDLSALADRLGLDHLEIRDARGTLLALSDADPRSDPVVDLASLEEDEVATRAVPYPSSASDPRIGWFVLRRVASGGDRLTVIGGRVVGRALVDEIAGITQAETALVDRSGAILASTGGTAGDGGAAGEGEAPARVTGEVPLGDGGDWRIRVSVPAGDARRERRALLVAFAGAAPIAAATALAVGLLLGAAMTRPIRALAARAEATAAEAAGEPLSPVQGGDEARRLELAMGRMLEALEQSERERGAAERIAAWQEVARRIAHEIKNPLAPIRIAVENLRKTRRVSPGEFERAFEEETATILEEVERLRGLLDEFASFARLPAPRPAPCDLRAIASETLALFAPRARTAGVEVALHDEGGLGTVLADPEQIGRVLKNVAANALDALEDSAPGEERRLTLALRPIVLSRDGAPVRFAEIVVRDTGVGFGAEALRRVFEPYFTTRAGRGGTGLGMAIAYRIVADHGGRILAEGAPGRGAVITVRIPVEGPPPAGPIAGNA